MGKAAFIKSRGPEGLQLEVGTRRDPEFLVSHKIHVEYTKKKFYLLENIK